MRTQLRSGHVHARELPSLGVTATRRLRHSSRAGAPPASHAAVVSKEFPTEYLFAAGTSRY